MAPKERNLSFVLWMVEAALKWRFVDCNSQAEKFKIMLLYEMKKLFIETNRAIDALCFCGTYYIPQLGIREKNKIHQIPPKTGILETDNTILFSVCQELPMDQNY